MQKLLLMKKKPSGGKRGPKPKPPEQVRSIPITFMASPLERERLSQAASLRGLTVSDFIRGTVLPKVDRVLGQAGE